jgi:hypothetical protein
MISLYEQVRLIENIVFWGTLTVLFLFALVEGRNR